MMPRSLRRGNRHPHPSNPRQPSSAVHASQKGSRAQVAPRKPTLWALFQVVSHLCLLQRPSTWADPRRRTLSSKILTAHHVHAEPKHSAKGHKPSGEDQSGMAHGIPKPIAPCNQASPFSSREPSESTNLLTIAIVEGARRRVKAPAFSGDRTRVMMRRRHAAL